MVAAADDRMPEVLGYADSGRFDAEQMPVNMRSWLQSYAEQMEYLNRHPEAAAPRRTVQGEAVSPLLQTLWDQGTPYNNLCPMDGESRSLTGCVATAMAQIMNYWKYPEASVAVIPGYITDEKQFEMPDIAAGTAIDWDNMVAQYRGWETEAQQQAVANLMLMCGTAVQMDYSAEFSGAWGGSVATGLLNYFDYDVATAYEYRAYYRTAQWNQMVYDELKAGRPVYYDGSSSDTGHAFVVDGYDGDDYFHVNWGWNGGSNGYFLLSILDPDNNTGSGATSSTDGYSFGQGAVFGAQPNTGNPVSNPLITTDGSLLPSGNEFTRWNTDQYFNFQVAFNYVNLTSGDYVFDFGIAAFSLDGQFLDLVASYSMDGPLPSGYGYYNASFSISLGQGISNLEFILAPVCRLHGTEEWHLNRGADMYYVICVIDGEKLTLYSSVFGLTGTLAATGKQEVGTMMPMTATVKNDGTVYRGEIFFLVDDKMVGGRHFDSDTGETQEVKFSFRPETEGDHVVSVCTRTWNGETQEYDYTPFISETFTIDAAVAANLSMTPTIKNAVKEYGDWYVKENTAVLSIQVTNNGTTTYDNDVFAYVFKMFNDQHATHFKTISAPVQLAPGATTTVEMEVSGLEDGAEYVFRVQYLSEGEGVDGYGQWTWFIADISVNDGIESLKTMAGRVSIYDLNGNKRGEADAMQAQPIIEALPKGVYILKSGKQTKAIRR